ncbi:site-specific integrase [Arenimonas sp.]|uniref:site-specific integrase n=1 Tax=Arenimonas sp. TaxID=1872635 RepID=UPI0039E255F8
MGTIRGRKRQNGTTGYTAQIRLKRHGQIVHTEAATFNTKSLATEWLKRREGALAVQRSRGEVVGRRMTVAEMVSWYETREPKDQPWGRTKKRDLSALRTGRLASRRVDQLTRRDFIEQIEARRAAGAGPSTAANDIIWLRQVLRAAFAVLGVPVPLAELDGASEFLRQERIIGKSKQRDRRLTSSEEAKLLDHFENRSATPMGDIIRFAMLTARRQDEIVRLRWEDLDRAQSVALLRDVKHPRLKKGNNKRFRMLAEAWSIIEAQPHEEGQDLVFPYNGKSIGTAFTRATKILGIDDLCFHDLRHEATSRLFERGYAIHEVAQFTLHESWATLKRYTHLRPQDVREL